MGSRFKERVVVPQNRGGRVCYMGDIKYKGSIGITWGLCRV